MMEISEILISDLMSEHVSTLDNDDTIGFALLTMVSNRFRRLPVVQDDVLVGILTSTDLLRSIDLANSIEILEQSVDSIMTSQVVVGTVDENFKSILQRMADKNVSCIPIIEDGRLRGIFTNKDLMLFNIFWRELPEYTVDKNTPGIIHYTNDFCIRDNETVQIAINKLIASDVKELVLSNKDGEDIGLISTQRVLRSIASTLIRKGLNISYLDKNVISRVVAEPIIFQKIPTKLNQCLVTMNKRGIQSLMLQQDGSYHSILTESTIKNLAWQLVKQ